MAAARASFSAAMCCCPARRPASASLSRTERDAASAFTAASALLQSRDTGLGRFRIFGKRLPEAGDLVPALGPAGLRFRKTHGKGAGFRYGRRKSVLQRRDVLLPGKVAGLGIAEPGREGRGLRLHRRQCLLQSRDAGLGRIRFVGERLPESGDFVPSRCTPAFGCRKTPGKGVGLRYGRRKSVLQRRDVLLPGKAAGLGIAEPGREGRGLGLHRRQCALQSRDTGLGRFRIFGKRLPEAGNLVPSLGPAGLGCRKTHGKDAGFRYGRRKSVLQRRDVLLPGKAAGLGIAEPGREGRGLRLHRRQCALQSRDTGLGRFRIFGKRLPEAGDFVPPARCTPAFGCRQLPGEKGGLVLRRRELLFQRRDAPGRRFNHLRKHPPEPGDLPPLLRPAGSPYRRAGLRGMQPPPSQPPMSAPRPQCAWPTSPPRRRPPP